MRRTSDMGRSMERILRWGTAMEDDDDRLLERFLSSGDESAFTSLLNRHGPMVLGVCRRILRDERDVEDAFQATFLVLVRRGGSIRATNRVGPWLHGVAHRVAVRARADSARRYVREGTELDVDPLTDVPPGRDADRLELRAILDEELARLPGRLRAPLVLCHLEGLTHDQAATRLRQPVGTIRSRLSRGRDKLRDRLMRRGVSTDDAKLGSLALADVVPPALLESTIRTTSTLFASTQPAASVLATAGAASLAQGVLDAMPIVSSKLAAVALGSALVLGGASGFALQDEPATAPPRIGVEERPSSRPYGRTNADQKSPKDEATQLAFDIEKGRGALEVLTMERDRLNRHIEVAEVMLARLGRRLSNLQNSEQPTMIQVESEASPPEAETPSVTDEFERGYTSRGTKREAVNRTRKPPFAYTERLVIALSADGRYVRGYCIDTGVAKTIPLVPGEKRVGVPSATPVISSAIGALALKGPGLQQLLVFSATDGDWHVQKLVEPTTEANPIVGETDLVAYKIGRHIYAFSSQANRWGVLETAEGNDGDGPHLGGESILHFTPGMLHMFSGKTGAWISLDIPKDLEDEASSPATE